MPNTITSPQQRTVRDFLNLRRPEDDDRSIEDVHPAVFALMQGFTDLKSERDARTAAEETANAPVPEIATKTRVDPSTGQTVHDVTYKNVQFGNAQAQAQEAHDAPQRELADSIDALLQNTARRYHLKTPGAGGELPEDLQQPALDTIGGKYRAEREAGRGAISAIMHALTLQALPDSAERDREKKLGEFDDRARKTTAAAYAKSELPIAGEMDRQARLNNEGRRIRASEQRSQARSIDDAINKTDWTLVPEEDRVANLAAQSGIDASQVTNAHVARIDRVARQQSQKLHRTRFENFRRDPGLGTHETFKDALTAWGTEKLEPEELSQLKADWKGKRQGAIDAAANQDRADQRLAKALAEKPEKPRKLRNFDVVDASTSSLLSTVGDPAFDQTSVRQALNDRRGRIEQKLTEIDAKMKGNAQTDAELKKIAYDKEGNLTPSAQLTPSLLTRLADAKGNGTKWRTEADALIADLNNLKKAGAQPAPPAPVTEKGGYAPQVETAIAAYMEAAHVGRAIAIRQLKKKERLK